MQENEQKKEDFSFKNYFVPLTTAKTIHWIIIIALITFANMLFNSFLWDDVTYIINNPQIQTLNFQTIFYSFKESLFNTGGEYRPITAIYFMLMYSIFGNTSFFYHIFQLFLHISNTILVFILFKNFFSKKISFFISLIFLVHPVQVEAVSYIASSGNPLFFLFGISALLLATKTYVNNRSLFIIFFLLLLSMFTRETGVLFIFLILFHRLIFHNKQLNVFLIGTLITLFTYLFLRFEIGGAYLTKLDLVLIARLSLVGRIINIPAIFYYYIKTLFMPITLSVDQEWIVQKINFSTFYFPLIIDLLFLIGVSILGHYIYKKQKAQFPAFIFFAFWFLIGVALHLQIFPLDFTVSDRWFYFPIVGLLGMLAFVIKFVSKKYKDLKIYVYSAAIVIIILLSVRTITRNTNWQNQLTLFSHDISIQDNFDSENNLGSAYTRIGNPRLALIHYQKSVALLPNDTNLFNLGYTYDQLGNLQNAKIYYKRVLENTDNRSTFKEYAFQALGFAYINNPNEAKKYAVNGLQDYPTDGSLYSILAISDYKLRNRSEALTAATKAKAYLPTEETNALYLLILNNKPLQFMNNL